MAFLGVALSGSGVLLGWSAFYLLGATLLVMVGLALSNYFKSSEVAVFRTILPVRVQRQGAAISYLHIANRSQRRFWGAEATQSVGGQLLVSRLPRLRRGEESTRTIALPTSRRGIYVVGPTVLSHRDSLSLVDVRKSHGTNESFMVTPRILPLTPIVTALTQNLEGKTDDKTPHGSMTFHQLREYVPGDDIRKIHWKATARQASTGTLIVRQDVDNAQPTTTVVVDVRPAGYSPDSFEIAVDFAASVVQAAAKGRSPFRLRLTSGASLRGTSGHAVDRAMEMLTEAGPSTTGSIQSEMSRLGHDSGGAVLVVVTGVIDKADIQYVANMRIRFGRVVLVSVTPEPRPPQHFTGISVIQGSTESDLIAAWNVGARR